MIPKECYGKGPSGYRTLLRLLIYRVWSFEVLQERPKVMLWSTPLTLRAHGKKDLVLLDMRRWTGELS